MTSLNWVPESCSVNSDKYVILGMCDCVDQKNRIFYIQRATQRADQQEQRLLHVWEYNVQDGENENLKKLNENLEKLKELSENSVSSTENQSSLQKIFGFGSVEFPKNDSKQYFGVILENLNGFSLSTYQDIYGLSMKEGQKDKQTKLLSFLQGLRIFYAVGNAILELLQKGISHQNISPRSIWMLTDKNTQNSSTVRTVMKPMLIDSYSQKAFDTQEYYQIWAPERHIPTFKETPENTQKRMVFELATLLLCLWKEDGLLWGDGRSEQLYEQKKQKLPPSFDQLIKSSLRVRDSDIFDLSDSGLHSNIVRTIWENENNQQQIQNMLTDIFVAVLSFNPSDRRLKDKDYTIESLLANVRSATLNISDDKWLYQYINKKIFPLLSIQPISFQVAVDNLKKIVQFLNHLVKNSTIVQLQCFDPRYMYLSLNSKIDENSKIDDIHWTSDDIICKQQPYAKYIEKQPRAENERPLKYSFFVFVIEVLSGKWLPDKSDLLDGLTNSEKVTRVVLRLKNKDVAKPIFDELHKILEQSLEEKSSFTEFATELIKKLNDVIDESVKKITQEQRQKQEEQRLKDEAERVAQQERERITVDDDMPTKQSQGSQSQTIVDDLYSTERIEKKSSTYSQTTLLFSVCVVLALISAGGWFYLRQQVAFTKTELNVNCDADDPSCLACDQGDIGCIESKGRVKLMRLQREVLSSPLQRLLSEDAVGICMLFLQNTPFSELDAEVQTQCLGQVARVDNGLSEWWKWWDSGYVNAMGQDLESMRRAIHIQCSSSGKTSCEKSYCDFTEQFILNNNAGECLQQPLFDRCVDGTFDYSGIVALATTKFDWCE